MSNTSVLNQIPVNTSNLQASRFSFTFPTLPFLRYFAQAVTLPGVSTSPVVVDTPFSNTFRHGDKLVYESLIVSAIIDEDIRVWEETYKWLTALTFPNQFPEYIRYQDRKASPYHDGILTINTNSNQPNIRIKFTNCHPSALTGINFSTMTSADTALTWDITFRYDGFDIERL